MGNKYAAIEHQVERVRRLEAASQRRENLLAEEKSLVHQSEDLDKRISAVREEIAQLDDLLSGDQHSE